MSNAFTGNRPNIVPERYSAQVAGTKLDVSTNVNHLVYYIYALNTTAAVAYLQIFDKQSADVTVGTTTPDLSFGIPANGALPLFFSDPVRFATGFTVAGTTARTGATGAALDVCIGYAERP